MNNINVIDSILSKSVTVNYPEYGDIILVLPKPDRMIKVNQAFDNILGDENASLSKHNLVAATALWACLDDDHEINDMLPVLAATGGIAGNLAQEALSLCGYGQQVREAFSEGDADLPT